MNRRAFVKLLAGGIAALVAPVPVKAKALPAPKPKGWGPVVVETRWELDLFQSTGYLKVEPLRPDGTVIQGAVGLYVRPGERHTVRVTVAGNSTKLRITGGFHLKSEMVRLVASMSSLGMSHLVEWGPTQNPNLIEHVQPSPWENQWGDPDDFKAIPTISELREWVNAQ